MKNLDFISDNMQSLKSKSRRIPYILLFCSKYLRPMDYKVRELGIWNVVLWHRWSWWTIHLNFPFVCYLCPPFMSWICYKLLSFLFRQHIFCWRCLKPGMRCQIPWTRNGWVQCGRIVSDWVLQPTRYLK